MAATNTVKPKRKKVVRKIEKGQVHIKSSFNNTLVSFTDMNGNVLSWSSSGKLGFKGSKKSTPFAAQQGVEDAAKVAKEYGIKSVEVYVKGPGNGREAAIRAIQSADIDVTLIKDVSPVAHNGCRPPKPRRI
ncbi:MAG: 30S ribosomal protein S11 [Christensenellales bacterium]|jgi:small subunit ribosomal protein S11